MLGVLWLNYEKAGHPESVTHAVTEEEVRFILGELDRPEAERTRLSRALERYLIAECRRGVFERRPVPLRGANDFIGWWVGGLPAKWLVHALVMREESRSGWCGRCGSGWLGIRGRGWKCAAWSGRWVEREKY
ncbi:MAG: hypothetical protein U0903_18155 [Planctomycetales bacterium]